jgi:16S rRNA (guanine527-N7)-methyltransferase
VRRALEALEVGAARVLGRALDAHELSMFEKYLLLLQKWQKIHRLVGSSEPRWIVEHLFLDSLLFLRVLPDEVASIADLGSGAGFPGVPIKIVRPDLTLTLIESRQRRASFLAAVIRELGLTRAHVLAARAEDLRDRISGSVDAVLARCAGGVTDVLPIAASFVTAGGIVIVSGSPSRRNLDRGTRVDVVGSTPGSTRSFVVLRP